MAVPPPRWDRPNRLNQAAAWVGIVAGVVFIVAVVFFSGLYTGTHYSGRYRDGDGRGMYYPGGGMMGPGQMGPGGMMGPGQMGPGGMMGPGQIGPGGMMGPGQMGPGGTMSPGQQSPTSTPLTPNTPRP